MADTPPISLLQLTDPVLDAMATNAMVAARFGDCLRGFSRAKPCCGQAARRPDAAGYAQVRDCIAGLNPTRKLELKRLLGAAKLRVECRRGAAGHRVVLTF
jgi:hypothetical protein